MTNEERKFSFPLTNNERDFQRSVMTLREELEKVEDACDLMYDDLRDLAEYYSNTKLTAEEKLKQMESVFDSRFGFVNGRLNLE